MGFTHILAFCSSCRWYRSKCFPRTIPAGHVCPPQPVLTSSWYRSGWESWPSNVMSVSPLVLRVGSGVSSSLMAVTGSSGGEGEGLTMRGILGMWVMEE